MFMYDYFFFDFKIFENKFKTHRKVAVVALFYLIFIHIVKREEKRKKEEKKTM